jgi:hypothetical protein
MTTEQQSPLPSISLATLPHKGLVRMCPSECIHVTYGAVTLDFHVREHFDRLGEVIDEYAGSPEAGIRLRHGHALLSFNAEEFQEFSGLVHRALEELRRVDTVRHLLTDGIRS